MFKILNSSGQSLMELVIGIGLIVVVAGAIAITTTQSLQNTQFSKNQVEATKKAQESIEKVRTIKNSNFGVCTQTEMAAGGTLCSTWEDIWTTSFGTEAVCNNGCTFILKNDGCSTNSGNGNEVQPFCLTYSAVRSDLGNGFTGQIIISDEVPSSQKKVTSRVFWTDSTGEHSSDLVTIFSRL